MIQRTTVLRFLLIALGALALAALLIELWMVITVVGPERGIGPWASVGWFLSYMTVLTNLWVAVFCTCVAMVPQTRIGRWMARYDVQAALLVYVLAVALVYHVLLTDAWDPQGWMKVVNVLMHVVIPVLYLVHWAMAAPKRTLRFGVLPLWLIYPVVYVVLAMCYGRATGRYPYPFLEVDIVGWASVVRTCAIILLGYALLAALIIVVNDRLAARERP